VDWRVMQDKRLGALSHHLHYPVPCHWHGWSIHYVKEPPEVSVPLMYQK